MKMMSFAKRNFKEIVRDPISLVFLIGLPVFLLVIFQQFKIPSDVYKIENFAPAIIVFGFTFITLFSGLLLSKDRTSSFLTRLFSSPLTAFDFVAGYSISIIPVALMQSILFLLVGSFLGLTLNINILITVLISLLISFLFVSMGLLIGCFFNDKQTPGFASIVIQLCAFTSGMWFDISMVSGFFKSVCLTLPFKYAVDLVKNALAGNFSNMLIPILIVLGYTLVTYFVAILILKRKMRS